MKKLVYIGEALIDFIPLDTGVALKEVSGFIKSPGGAPANVVSCVKKLGGKSQMISKLGNHSFGDFLEEKMISVGIDTTSILRTDKANTALAFISLHADGEEVKAIDARGAGDSFIGAVLYKLLYQYYILNLDEKALEDIITFANATGSLVVTKKGAIDVMPTLDRVIEFIKSYKE